MKSFFALLKLQLLSRYADLKPRHLLARIKEKPGRSLGMLLAYVVAIGYLGGALFFLERAMLDVMTRMGMPDLLLTMAVTLSMVSTLIMSFFFIMSSLYFGRDAALIASLPVKSRTVLSAKLCQVWVSEVGFSLIIILPAAIMYGIQQGAEPLFYLRALLAALGAPVLPIVIVAFVSTLLIRVSALWKRRDLITTVSGIAFVALYMFVAMNMGSMSGSGEAEEIVTRLLENNTARIEAMSAMFPPAGWAAKGILGDWGSLGLFLLCCLGAMALAVWAIGFVYQKLSLLQSETPSETRKKGPVTDAAYTGGSAFKANCLRELKQILRVPSYATNTLPIAFMPALMVVMMYFVSQGAMEEGETLETVLSSINLDIVMPILAALMAYAAGLNPALSTAVSREGKGHDFMNALPVSPRTLVLSKLTVGYALSLAGVLVAGVVIAVLLPAFALHAALAFILAALYTYAVCGYALARDVKHPRLDWVTEQEAVKQNMGVMFSMLTGWALLLTLGGLTYLLFTLGLGMIPYFLIMAALLGLICVLSHWYLLRTTDRYYCQG